MQKPTRSVARLLTVLTFMIPLVAACGGTASTPPASTAAPSSAQLTTAAPAAVEATSATTTAATSAPVAEATTAPTTSEATAVATAVATAATTGDTSATAEPNATDDAQAQPIGEQLDLTALSPDIPEPSSPVTVKFATWNAESEGLQKLADQFHTLHPNITIDFQGVPNEEIHDKLLTQVAGGTTPDVAYLDTSWIIDYASRSALANLDDYIAKSKAVKVDDYVPAFRDSMLYEKHMYGLPVDGESTGLFYRTDLFQAAGIQGPPKTWDELKSAAAKLTNKDKKQYGFILFAPEAAYYWYPWLWQAGGKLLSDDGKQIAFNDEAGKRAAEFYVGLKDYAPEDFLNSNSYDGRVAFANGTVAMYVAGAWFAGTLHQEFPDIDGKWAAAPLPQDKACATTIAGDAVVIFDQSKNKDAAWKWIEFLSAPQIMALQTIGTPKAPGSLLPPRTSLINDPHAYDNNDTLKGFAEQMKCGIANTAQNENYGQVEELLTQELGRAMFGEVDADAALEQVVKEGQSKLAK